jgi:uncharacterized membrane protein
MDIPFAAEHGQLTFRWIHVVAGVLWIGMLYFFNWVNAAFATTMDAETRRKVVPELMPRALFWFRWGAAWTWVTGFFLLVVLYYVGPYMTTDGTRPSLGQWALPFAGLFVGFALYDQLFKSLGKSQHQLAVVIWGLVAVGFAWALSGPLGLSSRAAFIHVGALFGTSMFANVWMRIWPAQRRIITAIRDGAAPDPADPALAGLRSKHNTYMSVPLLLLMVAVNQDALLARNTATEVALWTAIVLAIGWVGTWLVYKKVPSVKGF